jgi:DNA-binding transcriptional regulator GbsR (MarR family)
MSQWIKMAEDQGELVRKLKEEIKADPASHTKEELEEAVAKLKELKAKADDPMNALEDPVTKVSTPQASHWTKLTHTAPHDCFDRSRTPVLAYFQDLN